MYEETKSSIDWKGLFLKVIIGFLIVLIAVKGYTTLKAKNTNNNQELTTSSTVADKKASTTFTQNMEKLREAGKKYFNENSDKLPKTEGNTSMVTLNELVEEGFITSLSDEDGKICDVESSYVTAILENGESKLKANLVCGNSSNYSLVYMDENDSTTTSSSSTSSNGSASSSTSNTSVSSSGCSSSSCTPSVSVSTNTSVSQNVSINGNTKSSTSSNGSSSSSTSTNKNTYYTVSFDSNGGTISYPYQRIKYYNTVAYPGANQKSGCSFIGWYYNGSKYDFSTPVTKDMTLTAKYSCSSSYYYDDDYYYYDDNYYYDNDELVTKTKTTTVYSIAWDSYGINGITVNHVLRVPEYFEDLDIEKIKIDSVTVSSALTTSSQISSYRNNFGETFHYKSNGWEYNNLVQNNLAKVNKTYTKVYRDETSYKYIDQALEEGFAVHWTATDISSYCKTTFSVNGVNNLCGYGIVYKVTWKYQMYA